MNSARYNIKGKAIRISDEMLEKLAVNFIYFEMNDKYGWTFEQYVDKYLRGVNFNE